jgi:hypothetical protein
MTTAVTPLLSRHTYMFDCPDTGTAWFSPMLSAAGPITPPPFVHVAITLLSGVVVERVLSG